MRWSSGQGDFALYTAGMAAGSLAAKQAGAGGENQEDYPDYSRADTAIMELSLIHI